VASRGAQETSEFLPLNTERYRKRAMNPMDERETQTALLAADMRLTRGGRLRASQRSWLVCMFNHISALVPNDPSSRAARSPGFVAASSAVSCNLSLAA
jgi:hypothetical protein